MRGTRKKGSKISRRTTTTAVPFFTASVCTGRAKLFFSRNNGGRSFIKSADDFFALSKIKLKNFGLTWMGKHGSSSSGIKTVTLRLMRYCTFRCRSRWIIFFLFLSVSDSFSFSPSGSSGGILRSTAHTQLKGFTLLSCFVAPLNNNVCLSSSSTTFFFSIQLYLTPDWLRSGRIKTNAIVPFITPTCHGQEFRRDCNQHVRTIQ